MSSSVVSGAEFTVCSTECVCVCVNVHLCVCWRTFVNLWDFMKDCEKRNSDLSLSFTSIRATFCVSASSSNSASFCSQVRVCQRLPVVLVRPWSNHCFMNYICYTLSSSLTVFCFCDYYDFRHTVHTRHQSCSTQRLSLFVFECCPISSR